MKKLLSTILSLSLLAVAACSDEPADIVDTCQENCEYVGAAANCPDSVANEELADCMRGCEPFVSSLDAECQDAVEAVYLCSMSEYTYQCDDGSDVAFAEYAGDVDPCEEEYAAWAECMFIR